MKKRILAFIAAAAAVCLLSACGEANETSSGDASSVSDSTSSAESGTDPASMQQGSDQEDFLWQLSIAESAFSDGLHTVTPVTQYNGNVENVSYDNVPGEGNDYLLVNLTVKKSAAGNATFAWSDVTVKDAQGNSYNRHENDTFLSDHGYKRMAGTDLKLGTNEGWICFEIPKTAEAGALTLVHNAQEGENAIIIKS